jgi:hypothetical protein
LVVLTPGDQSITQSEPPEYEISGLKIIKYNHLIANLLIFHNCRTITLALKELKTNGVRLTVMPVVTMEENSI